MVLGKQTDLVTSLENALIRMTSLDGIGRDEIILDLSALPFIESIAKSRPRIIWLPDTVARLLINSRSNPNYREFLNKLFRRWTRRRINFDALSEIILRAQIGETRIRMITTEEADTKIYNLFLERLLGNDLVVELSPRLNLLGDIVGKIVGASHKMRKAIIMANRALHRLVRDIIPVLDAANDVVDWKTKFFEENLHFPVKRTRGIRWFVGITLGVAVSPVGIVLGILDP